MNVAVKLRLLCYRQGCREAAAISWVTARRNVPSLERLRKTSRDANQEFSAESAGLRPSMSAALSRRTLARERPT